MGIRKISILTAALFATNALAFPVPNRPCTAKNQFTEMSNISGMIQDVALKVDGRDTRTPLNRNNSRNYASMGITDNDLQDIRGAFGFVDCTKKMPNGDIKHNVLSGAVIGSNDQIVTNRHAFIDELGRPRIPLSQCTFQTFAEAEKGIKHQFKLGELVQRGKVSGTGKDFQFGSLNPTDADHDWVVVKLDKAVNARPFQVSQVQFQKNNVACKVNREGCQQMAAVSALYDADAVTPKSDPEVQTCNIRAAYGKQSESDNSILYNDCSATAGYSGSLNFMYDTQGQLIRDSEGRLMPFAIFATSADAQEGSKFSLETQAGADGKVAYNATRSVVLDGNFGQGVTQMAQGNSGDRNQQAASLIVPGAGDSL